MMERFFEAKGSGVSPLPHPEKHDQRQQQSQGEDEDDPLDAFMAGINQTIAKEKKESEAKLQSGVTGGSRGERFFDDEDVAADSVEYLQSLKAKEAEAATRKRKGAASDDEDVVRGRVLPVIDHDSIIYPPYQQDIYKEHPDISSLTLEAIGEVRDSLQLQTTGKQVPRPVASFAHIKDSLPRGLFNALTRRNYSLPTAVQAGAIPCLLKGRDCLCTAQTGSGKTAAYLLPLLARISHLNENENWRNKVASYRDGSEPRKDPALGPTAMVICPTRELAVQVDGEIHAFTRDLPIRRLLLAGGFDKTDQYKQLKHGPDVVVCNPGRAIDVCGLKGLEGCFSRLVFCVVDEADKMVQMGFDSQLKEILSSLRPDRITAMFSATMPPKCESIAQLWNNAVVTRAHANNMLRLEGVDAGAAKSVVQKVQVVDGENGKYAWLSQNLMQLLQQVRDLAAENKQFQQQLGGVIFVNSQQRVEDLAFLLDGALQQQLHDGGLSHPSYRLLHQHAEHGDAVSRAAAARMLGGDKAPDLKKNATQTYRYVATLHGGMQQAERLAVIRRMQQHYLSGSANSPRGCMEPNISAVGRPLFLVATDVAARGLDFPPGLNLVVCYDPPNDPEVYIHRVGRAGRAGRVGLAYSLLTKQEKKQAAFIVEQMEMGGQPIPHSLMEFAMQFPPFKQARLSGLRMVWEGGKKGKELRREQRNAVYGGLGYDSGATRGDVPKANSIGGNAVPSFATAAAVAAAATAASATVAASNNTSAEAGDGHPAPLESGGNGLGGSGKRGRWDSTVPSFSSTSDTAESGSSNNGTEASSTGARRSTLNLAKREQRRQQWLSQVEARRDQQQQQRTKQGSPPRRPFTERKPQDQQKPNLTSEEARAAYMKAHAAAWQLETSQGPDVSG